MASRLKIASLVDVLRGSSRAPTPLNGAGTLDELCLERLRGRLG